MSQPQPSATIADGVRAFQRRWPHLASTSREQPVFVLSAGWRSGSTLLQRLLMPPCLIWGEPYGRGCPIDAMCDTLRCITDRWPPKGYIYRGQPTEKLSQVFPANLYPAPRYIIQSHHRFFSSMFILPARQAGVERWGIKEVRLGVDHAHYLRWLYPRAKFLLLYRDPYNAYRSFAARREAGWRWFYQWPDQPLTVRRFGSHWRELAAGFLDQADEVGGHVVRFEDLAAGQYEAIEDYLGFALSREAAQRNPSDGGPKPLKTIPESELAELNEELGDLPASLGYRYEPRTD